VINRRNFIQKWICGAVAFLTVLLNPFLKVNAQSPDLIDTDYVGKTREGKFKNFYINFWKTMRRIRPETWTLLSYGLCKNPHRFTLEELKSLPVKTQKSRLKCVECWSAPAEWQGFQFSSLAELVQPLPSANGAVFHCADEYIEHISIETLMQERVLFAYNMDQAPLSDEHGFPLRLIVPFKYGYKNPKSILRIEWVNDVRYGTWSKIGPYSPDGTILLGYDHPLDRNKKRRRITGGEVPY
jgi:sulfoxide reductase catalytic subunit YedY